MSFEIESEKAKQPAVANHECSRNLLCDTDNEPHWNADQIAAHIGANNGHSSDLYFGMLALSQSLENRASGDFSQYNNLLQRVSEDTYSNPNSLYHLHLGEFNPQTGTYSNVELRNADKENKEGSYCRPSYLIVQPGETLSQIADDYQPNGVLLNGPYINMLARGNQIEDYDKIRVGQALDLNVPLDYYEPKK